MTSKYKNPLIAWYVAYKCRCCKVSKLIIQILTVNNTSAVGTYVPLHCGIKLANLQDTLRSQDGLSTWP